MRAQATAIADFAAVLRELRQSVDNPPFREMSGRSGAISHTTLHEATKGNRLPSWGTTVEFVKACGADPAVYRERWEQANRTVRSAGARPTPPSGAQAIPPSGAQVTPANAQETPANAEDEPVPDAPDDPPLDDDATLATDIATLPTMPITLGPQGPRTVSAASVPKSQSPPAGIVGVIPAASPASRGRGRNRLARPMVVVLAAAAAGLGTMVAIAVADHRDSGTGEAGKEPPGSLSKAESAPVDCPVPVSNPAPAPPTRKGDAAVFIADVTLPDCARVAPGKTVTKVWRLKNAGTVPWEGYSLHRLDLPQRADNCQTISDVPISDTQPGKEVDIKADITTPRKPGLCYVRFKLVDAEGRVAFPGNRPVNFQVVVEGAPVPRPGGLGGEPASGEPRVSGQRDPGVVRLENGGVA
ncbi:NBR1-Ig-like domain-containing protein [Actinomadura terrae]|uniref:NBR1-Ig-like domain-containing protein n=1 Tax=Actinomadura terrae TaxID=604353 RepID=UPI001FA80311|nr:NBR1-Ig-like domain-containing protein [Actinomadura terrae]